MKNFFYLILCVSILSCKEKNNTESTTVDPCDQIKNGAKVFRDNQMKRWNIVEEKIKKDSLSYGPIFVNKVGMAAITDPIEQLFAQYYITEFQSNNPATSQRQVGGKPVDIKRTESVWIDKNAILTFADQIINNKDIDGIRLYYSQYAINSSTLDPKIDAANNGRQTIIFVATTLDGVNHKDFFKPVSGGSGIYIYDYNSLCPDICAGSTLGGN